MKGSYMNVERTRLWADLQHAPDVLRRTLAARDGITSAAGLLRAGKVRRLVAVGNGASSYIAQALWLASLESPGTAPVQVTAVVDGAAQDPATLRPGESVSLIATQELQLSVNDGGAIQLTVNGSDVGTPGRTGKPWSQSYTPEAASI